MPRTVHFSPFIGFSGASKSMLTLAAEQIKHEPCAAAVLKVGPISEAFEDAGIPAFPAFPKEGIPRNRPQRWVGLTKALYRACKELDAELIHAHSATANRYAWPVAKRLGLPLVTHHRDIYQRNYFNCGLGLADQIICISDFVDSKLPPRLRAKSVVIHNAVALPEITACKREPEKNGHLRIGMAGRCDRDKGQDLLLEAFEALASENVPPVFLEIAGLEDNAYGRQLSKQLAGMPTRDRVQLSPYCKDIMGFFQGLDIVVVPSRFEEPFGRVAIEAMACGRAVIVTRRGGLTEIISDGENGLSVPFDTASLSSAILRLVRDPALRERLGSRGRSDAIKRFSAQNHYSQIKEIYNQLS